MTSVEIILGGPDDPASKNQFSQPDHAGTQLEKRWEVLIIEDELLVAESLKELLSSAGFAIAGIYASGEDAIQNFQTASPDLVLMDIRLAGTLDGIQTAIIIHQNFKKVPILFLTAYGEELLLEMRSLDSDLFDLLTKPYDKIQIMKSVENLLQDSGHRL